MKVFIVVLCLCLMPIAAWPAGKISSNELRKEAEEDICYAYQDYAESQNTFMDETGGSYRPSSYGGQLARDKDLKQARLFSLQKRYAKRYGKEFNPARNPGVCDRLR